MGSPRIWKMSVSCEDDRPMIDFEKHRYWDEWDELKRPFPRGVDTLPCEQLAFTVDLPDALIWDWYSIPGTGGVWSQRAKDWLWPYTQGSLRSFQTTLNGTPYYILRVDEELAVDCLDLEESDIEYFDAERTRVNLITSYVVRPNVIADPRIFHVPQRSDILATDSIPRIIAEAGLKGFTFRDAADLYAYYGRPRPSAG